MPAATPMSRWTTWCYPCDKARYHKRKKARAAARLTRTTKPLREYACPVAPGWHNGHLPKVVREGEMTAQETYGGRQVALAGKHMQVFDGRGVLWRLYLARPKDLLTSEYGERAYLRDIEHRHGPLRCDREVHES